MPWQIPEQGLVWGEEVAWALGSPQGGGTGGCVGECDGDEEEVFHGVVGEEVGVD